MSKSALWSVQRIEHLQRAHLCHVAWRTSENLKPPSRVLPSFLMLVCMNLFLLVLQLTKKSNCFLKTFLQNPTVPLAIYPQVSTKSRYEWGFQTPRIRLFPCVDRMQRKNILGYQGDFSQPWIPQLYPYYGPISRIEYMTAVDGESGIDSVALQHNKHFSNTNPLECICSTSSQRSIP